MSDTLERLREIAEDLADPDQYLKGGHWQIFEDVVSIYAPEIHRLERERDELIETCKELGIENAELKAKLENCEDY